MFFDRYDAGAQLADMLLPYSGSDVVVYALPRGGVLLGLEVAASLQAPLDLVITRKIGHPLNREFAICAITEDGERVCDEAGFSGLDSAWIDAEAIVQQTEAKRRRTAYKGTRASIPATGKTAIIVDDGVATGLTMKAAIRTIKKQKPKQVIVAVPVAPKDVVDELQHLVDEVVCIIVDPQFAGSVGAYYKHFKEVFDKEVQAVLDRTQVSTTPEQQLTN